MLGKKSLSFISAPFFTVVDASWPYCWCFFLLFYFFLERPMSFLHEDSKVCQHETSKYRCQSTDYYQFWMNIACYLDFEPVEEPSLNKLFALQQGITLSMTHNYGNIPLYCRTDFIEGVRRLFLLICYRFVRMICWCYSL